MEKYIIGIIWKSWSWKTTVVNLLNEELSLIRNKNYTTRKEREEEVGKVNNDYTFIDKEEFINKLENNYFIEYINHWGAFYWIPVPKNSWLLILDPLGSIQVEKWCYDNNIIFKSIYLDVDDIIRKERIWLERYERKEWYFSYFKDKWLFDYTLSNLTIEDNISYIKEIVWKIKE